MRASALACALATALIGAGAAHASPAHEAQKFLARYSDLTSRADIGALELYHDEARIKITYFKNQATEQEVVTNGRQWKQTLRAGWFDNTSRLEATRFEHVRVKPLAGQRILIRATRVSLTSCYRDTGYATIIAPQENRLFTIVEERVGYPRDAHCEPRAAGAYTSKPSTMATTN